MKLEDLGYNESFAIYRTENNLTEFEVGRVIAEHKERYMVKTEKGESEAEITGNLRFSAQNREDFPAVGDWVALISYDTEQAIIHKVFPRFSMLSRQAVGQYGEIQIIATNIDFAFVVQAVDRDFNINRLERYLTICYSSKVNPIVVLTKTDLINRDKILEIKDSIRQRHHKIPVIAISNITQQGYTDLKGIIEKGKTYCMLGSSGVGKSTLSNNLSGKEIMKTGNISNSTHKGKHVTSHRELIILDSGGILIDNPGMREVGITDTTNGLGTTFDQITQLSENCKFSDCKHVNETGCAVIEALENGDLDRSAYENYLKMEREKTHFESTVAEKRKKDKEFGKMVRNFKKDQKRVNQKYRNKN